MYALKIAACMSALVVGTVAQLAECDRNVLPDWKICKSYIPFTILTPPVGFLDLPKFLPISVKKLIILSDEIYDTLGWETDTSSYMNPSCDYEEGDLFQRIEAGCTAWRKADAKGNCQIGWCFFADGGCRTIPKGSLRTDWNILNQHCRVSELGGRTDDLNGFLEVINNADSKASDLTLNSVKTTHEKNGLIREDMSREDWDVLVALSLQPKKPKRQDVTWTTVLQKLGIAKENARIQVSQEMPPGVTETWTFTEGHSTSVSFSVGVSATLYGIFTAETSVTTTYEQSYSVAQGLSYTSGDCSSTGMVYWIPVYDLYQGFFSDNPNQMIDVWIPKELNDKAQGRFETVCLG